MSWTQFYGVGGLSPWEAPQSAILDNRKTGLTLMFHSHHNPSKNYLKGVRNCKSMKSIPALAEASLWSSVQYRLAWPLQGRVGSIIYHPCYGGQAPE